MPSLEYFLVARAFSVDQWTNLVSVFEIVEEVHPPAFPVDLPLRAICCWNSTGEEVGKDFQASIVLRRDEAVSGPHHVNFTWKARRHRLFVDLNVNVQGPGDVVVELNLNGAHSASHTITVHQVATVQG